MVEPSSASVLLAAHLPTTYQLPKDYISTIRESLFNHDYLNLFINDVNAEFGLYEYGNKAYMAFSKYYNARETAIEQMINNANSKPDGVQPIDGTPRLVLMELPALMSEDVKDGRHPLSMDQLILIHRVLNNEQLSKEQGARFSQLLTDVKKYVVPPGMRMQDINAALDKLRSGWERLQQNFQRDADAIF